MAGCLAPRAHIFELRATLCDNSSVEVRAAVDLLRLGIFKESGLVTALVHLDALVYKAYGLSPSCTDADRVAHLFKLYAEKTAK